MRLVRKKVEKIPIVNFGINEILPVPPDDLPFKFVMVYLGHLFFFRIQKNSDEDFPNIYNCFIKELMELFSVKREKTIKKVIRASGGGYLWATKKSKVTEINISGGYGCVEILDQDTVIELLKKEL
jgi:hypothetical protein